MLGIVSASTTGSTKRRPDRIAGIGWLTALCLLVAAGRLLFVGLFAESIPYWDEWDAEGDRLLKPWMDGTWSLGDLFAAHNEHRIVFTRLIALFLFWANQQQWDNLPTVHANIVIYAITSSLFFFVLTRAQLPQFGRTLLLAIMVALAWLPFGFTNSLAAFQNQFYLMTAFAVATIAIAACGPDRWTTILATSALALLGLFTMASGVLGAVAAGGVIAARMLHGQLGRQRALAGIALLVAVTVFGLDLVSHVPGHDPLKATSVGTWWQAMQANLTWPLPPRWWFTFLLWLPCVAATYRLLRRKAGQPPELLLGLGVAAWVILQCAAMAYSRGGEGAHVGLRYVDTLAVGLVANTWLALRLLQRTKAFSSPAGLLPAAVAGLYAALFVGVLAHQASAQLAAAKRQQQLSLLQIENVRRFVAEGDPQVLEQPFMHIPYPDPDPDRLASLLSDPTIRQMLPASVRSPVTPAPAGTASASVRVRDMPGSRAVTTCGIELCAEETGRWDSAPFRTRLPRIAIAASVDGRADGLAIEVTTPDVSPHRHVPRDGWNIASVPPGRPVRLGAIDDSDQAWMAFDMPVEIGRLSALSLRLQAGIRQVLGTAHGSRTSAARLVGLPVDDGTGEAPRVLDPQGPAIRGRFVAPRDGWLDRFSLLVGTYHGASNGRLQATLCLPVAETCSSGSGSVDGTPDNGHLVVVLDDPLRTSQGQEIAFSIELLEASHPLAVWTTPARDGQAVLDGDGADTPPSTPRIALGYVD